MATHKCPKNGCERQVPRSQFACRSHWYAISKPVRDAIWAGYRSGDREAHVDAMLAALEELNGSEPPC